MKPDRLKWIVSNDGSGARTECHRYSLYLDNDEDVSFGKPEEWCCDIDMIEVYKGEQTPVSVSRIGPYPSPLVAMQAAQRHFDNGFYNKMFMEGYEWQIPKSESGWDKDLRSKYAPDA